jgi:exodeoxyribonuclease-3
VQPESRAAFRRLLDQGWLDAIRARHPTERIYTFWDYMRKRWERNAGLRIDHLLLNPQMAKRLVDANVDKYVRGKPGASDHAPTWIEVSSGRTPVKRGKAVKRTSRGRPSNKVTAES